jgi:hypothetical protein
MYRYDVCKPYTAMRHERLSTSMYIDTICVNHIQPCDTSDSPTSMYKYNAYKPAIHSHATRATRPRSYICIYTMCSNHTHSCDTRATADLDLYRCDVFKPCTAMRHERLPATAFRYDVFKQTYSHATRATLDLNLKIYDVLKPYTIMRHERLSISMYIDTMCSKHTQSYDTRRGSRPLDV